MRSRYRCSMCPAIHINSRSWLRSSSTHEPSDPPLRVIFAPEEADSTIMPGQLTDMLPGPTESTHIFNTTVMKTKLSGRQRGVGRTVLPSLFKPCRDAPPCLREKTWTGTLTKVRVVRHACCSCTSLSKHPTCTCTRRAQQALLRQRLRSL